MCNKKFLFGFAYAGGTAAFYDKLESCLAPDICLIKLEYAGHGTRYKEPFYDSFKELSNDLYSQIREIMLKEEGCVEYSLLGYSMGSISALEVLQKILREGEIEEPKHIFLAAHTPFIKNELLRLHTLHTEKINEYVKEWTISFGGIPESLIDNKSFWRFYLPIYRADYIMLAKYRFERVDLKTTISTTIFYSETDTKYVDMKKWTNFFVGDCMFVKCEGQHFFIGEHYEAMASIIRKRME